MFDNVYLKLDREQETADNSDRSDSDILPACQGNRFRVIPENVSGIEPAPGDAGATVSRLCCLCYALKNKQSADGEELDEGGEHLDK